jgi:hypothetical protein
VSLLTEDSVIMRRTGSLEVEGNLISHVIEPVQ